MYVGSKSDPLCCGCAAATLKDVLFLLESCEEGMHTCTLCVPRGCGGGPWLVVSIVKHEVIIDSVGGLNRTLYVFLRGIFTLTQFYLAEYQIVCFTPTGSVRALNCFDLCTAVDLPGSWQWSVPWPAEWERELVYVHTQSMVWSWRCKWGSVVLSTSISGISELI